MNLSFFRHKCIHFSVVIIYVINGNMMKYKVKNIQPQTVNQQIEGTPFFVPNMKRYTNVDNVNIPMIERMIARVETEQYGEVERTSF